MLGFINWISVISVVAFVLCFYFTLNFFQYLKSEENREMQQSKIAAVVFLAISIILPTIALLISQNSI